VVTQVYATALPLQNRGADVCPYGVLHADCGMRRISLCAADMPYCTPAPALTTAAQPDPLTLAAAAGFFSPGGTLGLPSNPPPNLLHPTCALEAYVDPTPTSPICPSCFYSITGGLYVDPLLSPSLPTMSVVIDGANVGTLTSPAPASYPPSGNAASVYVTGALTDATGATVSATQQIPIVP
jgi:hypothetical protein